MRPGISYETANDHRRSNLPPSLGCNLTGPPSAGEHSLEMGCFDGESEAPRDTVVSGVSRPIGMRRLADRSWAKQRTSAY
jgi:hypothetical protein